MLHFKDITVISMPELSMGIYFLFLGFVDRMAEDIFESFYSKHKLTRAKTK